MSGTRLPIINEHPSQEAIDDRECIVERLSLRTSARHSTRAFGDGDRRRGALRRSRTSPWPAFCRTDRTGSRDHRRMRVGAAQPDRGFDDGRSLRRPAASACRTTARSRRRRARTRRRGHARLSLLVRRPTDRDQSLSWFVATGCDSCHRHAPISVNESPKPPLKRIEMKRRPLASGFALALLLVAIPAHAAFAQGDPAAAKPGRDPKQAIDEEYTKKIREYTTEPFFLSPLVDYLPASKTVPTPKVTLGDIAGAPTKLPY